MTKEQAAKALDPFVTDGVKHPNRKVGLGLPFLVQMAEQSGGGWSLDSQKGSGTKVSAWFDTSSLDFPPVGDLPGMFRSIFMFAGPEELVITRRKNTEAESLDYQVKRSELLDALGSLEDTEALLLLGTYFRSLEGEEEKDHTTD
jgi:hypothetical protein